MSDLSTEQWATEEEGEAHPSALSPSQGGAAGSPAMESDITEPCPDPIEMLAERLADDMVRRWHAGQHALTEEYLAKHPELGDQPKAAVGLIFEEICLRQELGEAVSPEDVFRRFPQWRAQLEAMLKFQELLQPGQAKPRFPRPGEYWEGFKLIAELGRGGRGRVFVATQPSLGDRQIVLKLTALEGKEHLSLAGLQHTNIVPLYQRHDDPARHLRGLCMPYFGGATLGQILDRLRERPLAERKGQDFLQALEEAGAAAQVSRPIGGPHCSMLAGVSYVHAICWIGAHLADALQYAHERSLVHLDVKPSNVLVAADGQPMLLDFHLARPPLHPGGQDADWLGGTSGYMAPEQSEAIDALRAGDKITKAVDGRADVYSLGVVLYEALAGELPGTSPRPLRRRNPRVSLALSDLIAKCLAPDPKDRLPNAAALATDLRRHISDLPLRGVANSLLERWHKWRRRRPQGLMATALIFLVLAAGVMFWREFQHQFEKAEAHRDEGQVFFNGRNYMDAARAFERGLLVTRGVPFSAKITRELERKKLLAEQALDIERLHALVDRMRFLYERGELPDVEFENMEQLAEEFWQRRNYLRKDREWIPPYMAQGVDTDLQDLAILSIERRMQSARSKDMLALGKQALETLDQAEQLLGPSRILYLTRRTVARKLQSTVVAPEDWQKQPDWRHYDEVADLANKKLDTLPPGTLGERYAVARFYLQHEPLQLDAARKELKELTEVLQADTRPVPSDSRDSQRPRPWPWTYFYIGKCEVLAGNFQEAEVAFDQSVRKSDRDSAAGCYYNRALSRTKLDGHTESGIRLAIRDYDDALDYDPKLIGAYMNRGTLKLRLKLYDAALRDFRSALDNKAGLAPVHYEMALVYEAKGDVNKARDCLQTVLQQEPTHEKARQLMNSLSAPKK